MDDERPAGRDRMDGDHQRPEGVDDATVKALGTLSKALETVEQARGHLYAFHQLTGTADFALGDAVDELRAAGHTEQAELLDQEMVGRNVIPGHWTFQIIEAYNASYYRRFNELEARVRGELAAGRQHVYEAELKENRRTRSHPDHTATP